MDKKSNNSNIFGNVSLANAELFSDVKSENKVSLESQQKMINDFDSSLILENIDKNVKNKAVRLNLKINTIKKNLSKINEEFDLLELLNLEKDVKRRAELKNFKTYLENELEKLKSERKKFGILYFFSGFFADKVDYSVLVSSFNSLKNEIKKYDKAAISFIKSKKISLLPFKW